VGERIQVAEAFRHLNAKQGLSEGISAGFSRIGYKDKVWCLFYQGDRHLFVREDDGTQLPYLDVVIITANKRNSRVYYTPGTYSQDSANPPVCASTMGDVPDKGVPIPQSTSCHTCVNSQWRPNRGGKPCQEHRRAAVIVLPYMKTRPKLSAPIVEPVFFKIPPASLKSWKAYVDELEDDGIPIASVITRVTFSTDKQFQMIFKVQQALTDKEAPLVLGLLEDRRTLDLIGSMAEMRTVDEAPKVALPPDRKQQQVTGLAAAFAQQQVAPPQELRQQELTVPAKRGRKPKTVEEHELVEEIGEQNVQEPASENEEGEAQPPWEGGDAELDDMMADVLRDKASKAMK